MAELPGAMLARAAGREEYEALLGKLEAEGKLPDRIVHLGMLTGETDVERLLQRGFYDLLGLSQALGERSIEQCRIDIVSSGMQDVVGGDRTVAAKATVLGPVRVIQQEYPNLRARSIDLESDGSFAQLRRELAGAGAADIVALRGKHRWVQNWERARLQGGPGAGGLKQGGVYLITGGLGGIGLALADYLASQWQAKLVLLARHLHPDRIARARSLGAEVIEGDTTAAADITRAIERAGQCFGRLDGVMHTAGVPGSGMMQWKTAGAAANVLAPKVRARLALARPLRGRSLDFLALFSSLTSVTGGGPGQVDYCAANAFLDAWARNEGREFGAISIGWGEWLWDAWQEGLNGFPPAVQAKLRANRKAYGFKFDEGFEALRRIASSAIEHVCVTTRDLDSILRDRNRGRRSGTAQKPRHAFFARPPAAGKRICGTCFGHGGAHGADLGIDAGNCAGGPPRQLLRVGRELAIGHRIDRALAPGTAGGKAARARALRSADDRGSRGLRGNEERCAARGGGFRSRRPSTARRARPRYAPQSQGDGIVSMPSLPENSIAIVGMAGRFPGARNIDEYWSNIASGVRSIPRFSDRELLTLAVPRDLLELPNYVKAGTVIKDVDCFDAPFFGFSPREAEVMDPQHRIFLECAWESLEDAGCSADVSRPDRRVCRVESSLYLLTNLLRQVVEDAGMLQVSIHNEPDSLTSTVSYKLNLRGPSVAVQTFCSTSLVAVHMACQSLLKFECELALAGGVSAERSPRRRVHLPGGRHLFSGRPLPLLRQARARHRDRETE